MILRYTKWFFPAQNKTQKLAKKYNMMYNSRKGGDFLYIINNLLDGFFCLNPTLILVLAWAILPLGIFAVSRVFESRHFPLWRGQSKMFFPGDLMPGILLSEVATLTQKKASADWHWYKSGLWLVVTIIIIASLFVFLRHIDTPRYEARAAISPTKLYHDICGYIIFAWLLLVRGVPELLHAIIHPIYTAQNFSLEWIIILLSGPFYLWCAWYDYRHPENADFNLRHPADWKPFWRKN